MVLSSADTELALLAAAQARRRVQDPGAPSLRLAPILRLGHNFSVDLYMETVARARLVIARVLGGSAYWPYGVERLAETCRANHIPLALLPGDDKPDAELAEQSTIGRDSRDRLWRYLAEGGPANADNLLRYAASLIGHDTAWAEPAPLLRAGLYWPDRALPSLDDIAADWRGQGGRGAGGVVPIVFYRALVQSGNTAPVDALVRALAARRLRPLPIFVQSLKDGEAAALIGTLFAAPPPAVILNATGFSVRAGAGEDPLAAADCPVLQVVFSGGDEESWRAGTRGLARARSGDERGPARNRRPHPVARGVVQGAARPRSRDRDRSGRLSAGRRPRRLCRRPGAQLGAAAREAAGRAPGRIDPRQLSEPRRPYRQRRRPRHPGLGAGDPACARPAPATGSTTSPTIRKR